MRKNSLYEQLISSEPLGFIDPLTDLGEFDVYQMKFKEPVRDLKNKYSGQRYSSVWQVKIEQMRELYIAYQKSLRVQVVTEETPIVKRTRKTEDKYYLDTIISTYLTLGFLFPEIEKRVSLSLNTLRNQWNRSDYVTSHQTFFYQKDDVKSGYYSPQETMPRNVGQFVKKN